jgi:KAP family P-loop domain
MIRSWWAGMITGVPLVAACSTALSLRYLPAHRRVAFSAYAFTAAIALVELWQKRPSTYTEPKRFPTIPTRTNSITVQPRWIAKTSDNPITDFAQDILGRTAVVELLAEHALTHRTPVVALHGDLGDGKTSVLNLLRKLIERDAIVVSFSAWLPGSESTLALDLFRDIATECRKAIYVPQLRKRALSFARTLSGSASFLSGLKELIPNQSQKDEIQELHASFARIPVPIVVLLDEVDRMQKDELFVLLKIIRGASSIPNVTFICAYSEDEVRKRLDINGDLSYDYLEKFFPVSVNLSAPAPDLIGRCFRAELHRRFSDQSWFKDRNDSNDSNDFAEQLEDIWTESLQNLCTNFRKAGLLVNDSTSAAQPVVGEVNPLDLVMIEALRRFSPSTYHKVRTSSRYFTEPPKRPYAYEDVPTAASFYKDLNAEIEKGPHPTAVRTLLAQLFPDYASAHRSDVRLGLASRRWTNDKNEAWEEKRVSKPQYFPIYFRGAVPEEMFSNAELHQVISALHNASTEAEVDSIYDDVLRSIPTGHAKRTDFLWKLAREAVHLGASRAEHLAYAVARHASDYQYDLGNAGEPSHALHVVFTAAQKHSNLCAQRVLEGATVRATHDSFAWQILNLTGEQKTNILTDYSHIDIPKLRLAFCRRMRQLYGPGRSNSQPKLLQLDWWAFRDWASSSDEDRCFEQDFWRGFMTTRKLLAQAINFVFPGFWYWNQDPTPIINEIFPLEEFARLLRELPESTDLDESEKRALDRMQQLIEGKYFTGFPTQESAKRLDDVR